MGAVPVWVMAQIVVEAVILTALAGLLGLAAGIGVVELVAALLPAAGAGGGPQMFQNPGVEPGDALRALTVLIAAGALAGVAPAQRAIAVPPVVALRSE